MEQQQQQKKKPKTIHQSKSDQDIDFDFFVFCFNYVYRLIIKCVILNTTSTNGSGLMDHIENDINFNDKNFLNCYHHHPMSI